MRQTLRVNWVLKTVLCSCLLMLSTGVMELSPAMPAPTAAEPVEMGAGMACRAAASPRFFEENGGDYWLQLGSERVHIIGRGTWGAAPVIREGRSWKAYPAEQPVCAWIHRITVHHTEGIYTIQSLQIFHQHLADPKADIAYHFFIDSDGLIYEGRPLGIMGSHSEADNGHNVGIVLNGNFQVDVPSPAQLESLRHLLLALRCPCFAQDGVWTHRQRKKLNFPHQPKHWTLCPGDHLQSWVEKFTAAQN